MNKSSVADAKKRAYLIAAIIVWFGVVATGLGVMAAYANRPGESAHAPAHWPAESRLTRNPAGPTLVMLVHPKCDCTRASLAELARLMTHSRDHVRAFVVVMRPAGVEDGWADTYLWDLASRIPGVTVRRDEDEQEVSRFGAETSGQTLLYDAEGQLVFSGGTTASRGHEGDNAGVAAMLAHIEGDRQAPATAPVFGCELHNPAISAN